jgi:hypothetical protein
MDFAEHGFLCEAVLGYCHPLSSKWTIRLDRSQNSRTEALNLIRNRKCPLPHIVVVTEPLPSRIASIAMGTGDIAYSSASGQVFRK